MMGHEMTSANCAVCTVYCVYVKSLSVQDASKRVDVTNADVVRVYTI